MPSSANQPEYSDLALALELLAERAPAIDAAQLTRLWPELERRLLACVQADEQGHSAGVGARLLPSDGQRLRNLAWEVGVSVDLYAVHLGALRTLANLVRERGQRLAAPEASRGSNGRARSAHSIPG